MPKLQKHKSWKARHINLITGVVFVLISITAFLTEGWWRLILFSFFPVGIVEIGLHFWYGRENEYLLWDEEKIEIFLPQQKPIIYKWKEIEAIKISKDNLTIKSGTANGIILDLKGYNEREVENLSSFFSQKSFK